MLREQFSVSWRFWLFWMLAFAAFPIGGLLSNVLVGPVTTPIRAILAGAITGAVLGLIQWFVLKGGTAIPIGWILATAAGMAVGLGLSVAAFGSEASGNALLWRAVVTGLCVGVAQWIILRPILPQSATWILVIALGWAVGWFVTRSAGVDLSLNWSVFGATGALAFQLITGLALYFLIRFSTGVK